MREYELISHLFGDVRDLFKSDSQIIEIGGERWGMTCDTFSLEEDLFTPDNPYRLGHNLVVATLGDLSASGCKPIFYQHAITFAKKTEASWMNELARGIKDALKIADCTLIGGDTGCGEKFSYTGIGLGRQIKNVSRILPEHTQKIYVSGTLGDANSAIVLNTTTPAFEWRGMPQNMLACIDTSSGFMDALWQLHILNPNHKFELKNLPASDIRMLFGGAGEYELIFTSDKKNDDAVLIGEAVFGDRGVFIDGKEIQNPPPDPRSYESLHDYMNDINTIVQNL